MQTLYIDVYFLINFTVDILAIYFAVSFSSVPTSRLRLVLGGAFGALFAMAALFVDEPLIKLTLSLVFAFVIAKVSVRGVTFVRRLKFFFAFLIFETIIGGLVYYAYSLLDKYIYEQIVDDVMLGEENRSILIISIIVLLSVGVFKLFLSAFSSEGRRGCVEIELEIFSSTTSFEAFIDSGNLLRDPVDMRAVLLIKNTLAKRIFPDALCKGRINELSIDAKRCIRIIPITRECGVRILTGVRPKRASVILKNGKKDDIDVIVAIDNEGGSYDGYEALVPSSAIEDIV